MKMENSLKSVLAIFLVFAVTNLHAQVKFGPKVGLNLSTMTLKSGGLSLDPKTKVGFHIGGIFEIPLKGNFALQPGILYSLKGSKYKVDTEEMSIAPNYIEIPVCAVYHFGAGAVKISPFAGPYFAYAIDGKTKSGGESANIKFGSENYDDMKPFDIGLTLGVGVHISSLLISAQFGLGLANLSPVTTDDTEMKNRVIGISLAYLIGGK
jgi:hypothetical protein